MECKVLWWSIVSDFYQISKNSIHFTTRVCDSNLATNEIYLLLLFCISYYVILGLIFLQIVWCFKRKLVVVNCKRVNLIFELIEISTIGMRCFKIRINCKPAFNNQSCIVYTVLCIYVPIFCLHWKCKPTIFTPAVPIDDVNCSGFRKGHKNSAPFCVRIYNSCSFLWSFTTCFY